MRRKRKYKQLKQWRVFIAEINKAEYKDCDDMIGKIGALECVTNLSATYGWSCHLDVWTEFGTIRCRASFMDAAIKTAGFRLYILNTQKIMHP